MKCPVCERRYDDMTNVSGLEDVEAGDVVICLYCAAANVSTGEGFEVRRATPDELIKFARNPTIVCGQLLVRASIDRRGW